MRGNIKSPRVSGTSYYRARYYNPLAGRFVGGDTLQYSAGQNFYEYVWNGPVRRIDPFGLDWLKNLSDFSGGAGDAFSLVPSIDMINDATGGSSVVDKCSLYHKLGTGVGIAVTTALGGAAGAEAAEANAGRKGFEFSHWIPDRMGGPRSIFNGNYVSRKLAYLTDPYRYPPGRCCATPGAETKSRSPTDSQNSLGL